MFTCAYVHRLKKKKSDTLKDGKDEKETDQLGKQSYQVAQKAVLTQR